MSIVSNNGASSVPVRTSEERQRLEPFTVYVADVSYFSGKFEAYLRYKDIPFIRREATANTMLTQIYEHTGFMKVPAVETADGQWLKDTTPMLDWFEALYPQGSIMPSDPVSFFMSKLIEDYADEWCWRAAMYYRWNFPDNAHLLARRIGREVLPDWPLPDWLTGSYFGYRQKKIFLKGDGLSPATEPVIRQQYLTLLESLTLLLQHQPFLTGNAPSLVDFGFMGPFFRHYACDPIPNKIMRDAYPAVYEWVARMWNAKASRLPAATNSIDFSASGWARILKEIAGVYMPYLVANAAAWKNRQSHFDFYDGSVVFKKLPVIHYRVYCLEMLQHHFFALSDTDQTTVQQYFSPYGSLTMTPVVVSGLREEFRLPLKKRRKPFSWWEYATLAVVGTPWDMPSVFRRRQ